MGSTGHDLPVNWMEEAGNGTGDGFNVSAGREYYVYAMSLRSYGLGFLVVDDTGRPGWMPMELFEVVDGRIPSHWEFAPVERPSPVLALWGYPTVIRDASRCGGTPGRNWSALGPLQCGPEDW